MKHQIAVTVLVVMVVLGSGCIALAGSENQGLTKLDMSEGQVTMEVVGQVTNTPADVTHPMGSSMQYGYVSHLNGFANVFSSNNAADQNESTAQLTFYTEVTTKSVTVNGPFSIIIREGTTTIYLNSGAANFSSPNSFRSGTPIQTSTIRQQAIVDAPPEDFHRGERQHRDVGFSVHARRSAVPTCGAGADVSHASAGRSVHSQRRDASADRTLRGVRNRRCSEKEPNGKYGRGQLTRALIMTGQDNCYENSIRSE